MKFVKVVAGQKSDVGGGAMGYGNNSILICPPHRAYAAAPP